MPDKKPIILNQQENNNGIIIDEQTGRRIHEHLMNENDEISDDDLRNAKTTSNENHNDDSINHASMVDDKLIGDDIDVINAEDKGTPNGDVSDAIY